MGGDLSSLLAAAEAALAAVAVHPGRAQVAARDVLTQAGRRHPEVSSVAHRAVALAAVEQGDLATARRSARSAVRAAERSGGTDRLAQAVCTEAGVLLVVGERERAMASAAEAVRLAGPAVRADALAQQATLLLRSGRHREAARVARDAMAAGGPVPDPDVLVALGGALFELGDLDAADRTYEAAVAGYRAAGSAYAAAMCEHNRAVVAVRRGRVPEALRSFASAAGALAAEGLSPAYAWSGEVAAMLEAGLTEEAAAAAGRASEAAARAELSLRGGVLLLAARSALAAGDLVAARSRARAGAAAFARLGEAGARASCHLLVAQAARPPATPAAARRQVAELAGLGGLLARSGRVSDAVAAHLAAVQRGLAAGVEVARLEGSADAVGRLRPRSTGLARAAGHEAEARLALARGDLARARRAAGAGLDVVDALRAGWGGTELRAQASRHGTGLAEVAVAAALAGGRADEVLCWAERWRAAGVRRAPASSPATADLLAALRRARADAEAAQAAGERADQALRTVAQLEATLRREARHVAAETPWIAPTAPGGRPGRVVRAALGERALLELVEHGASLHAVVVTSGRSTLHHLGPVGPVLAEVDALGGSLRRLGRAGVPEAVVLAARRAAEASLAALGRLLVEPLRRRLGDGPVVVVPTADLHAVPWPALAGLAGRPVTVAPSSLWWAAARRRPVTGSGPALLASGPGLPGAEAEVRRLGAAIAGGEVLTGPAATPEAVAARLPAAGLAHLACHGHFRADNPMCSWLALAGGPLTVYDLEAAGRTPPLVVLSACDSGVPATRPGDELLGLTAALVSLGSTAVVASVVAVPDLDAADLMVALHRHLAGGREPAAALQAAAADLDPDSPTAFATRHAFVCFGAG